ncbi:hypothetical protein B0H16DRAFT_1696395 [Mycena metata]|uniref:Uncharacterized protein n=1 Tax=Mycena metata TaxID=1033252 RepID=A0AAD7MVJ9_9AGAR|nr:hypothetical protein B0H16DRAFT_1696395 [Mycena metata]
MNGLENTHLFGGGNDLDSVSRLEASRQPTRKEGKGGNFKYLPTSEAAAPGRENNPAWPLDRLCSVNFRWAAGGVVNKVILPNSSITCDADWNNGQRAFNQQWSPTSSSPARPRLLPPYLHSHPQERVPSSAPTPPGSVTLGAAFALFVSPIGYPGILLNNRPFLAVYTAFGLLVVPGYITYKRRTLNLEAKVNQQWSQELGAAGRLTIQSVLGCSIMAAGLLCSNHVTYRFGKGMMPKAYRLSREAMAVIMEQYASVHGAFFFLPVAPFLLPSFLPSFPSFGLPSLPLRPTLRFEGAGFALFKTEGEDEDASMVSRTVRSGVVHGVVGCQLADQYGADAAAHMIANNSGNTGPCAQTHTRGTGSGLSGLGSGRGSGGYAQMPPNPFSPNPTPAASASDLNLAGPRPHQDEDGDEEGDGYSYGYGAVEEGDENGGGGRGRGGDHVKYESLDIGAASYFAFASHHSFSYRITSRRRYYIPYTHAFPIYIVCSCNFSAPVEGEHLAKRGWRCDTCSGRKAVAFMFLATTTEFDKSWAQRQNCNSGLDLDSICYWGWAAPSLPRGSRLGLPALYLATSEE